MSSPMTLREAVEIERAGVRARRVETPAERTREDAEWARFFRARAIVDAAVEFVEAREQEWDGLTPHPGAIDLFYKLRALERGESEVKP